MDEDDDTGRCAVPNCPNCARRARLDRDELRGLALGLAKLAENDGSAAGLVEDRSPMNAAVAAVMNAADLLGLVVGPKHAGVILLALARDELRGLPIREAIDAHTQATRMLAAWDGDRARKAPSTVSNPVPVAADPTRPA